MEDLTITIMADSTKITAGLTIIIVTEIKVKIIILVVAINIANIAK